MAEYPSVRPGSPEIRQRIPGRGQNRRFSATQVPLIRASSRAASASPVTGIACSWPDMSCFRTPAGRPALEVDVAPPKLGYGSDPVTRLVREHECDAKPPVQPARHLRERPVVVLGEHHPGRVLLRGLSEALERVPVEKRPGRPSISMDCTICAKEVSRREAFSARRCVRSVWYPTRRILTGDPNS